METVIIFLYFKIRMFSDKSFFDEIEFYKTYKN